METIFDYSPTTQELIDIRFDSFSMALKFGIEITGELTPEICLSTVSQENAYYDLACLFEFRNDQEKADYYWSKLPSADKDGLGCDDVVVPIND
jgi:hypothetical protein